MSCFDETNRQIAEGFKSQFGTTKGLKEVFFGLGLLAVAGSIIGGGILLSIDQRSFVVFMSTTLVSIALAMGAMIYMVTLYNNCNPEPTHAEDPRDNNIGG